MEIARAKGESVMKIVIPALLGLALAAWPGLAQDPVAVQLQKGIFAQQTTGDLDAAIQIFRQIVASNPAERIYAAQAQMHLAQSLLAKGDLNGAAQEFNNLAANYSEFKDVVAGMAKQMAGIGHGRVFSKGTVTLADGQPDRYQHRLSGVALTAPADWRLEGDGDSSGGGEIVMFSSSKMNTDVLAVWMKPATGDPGDIAGQLRSAPVNKLKDRTDFDGWTVRPESIQMRTVAGQQALSAVADYNEYTARTKPQPVKMAEYLIWVRSAKTHALLFGRARLEDLPTLQAGLDQLAATSVIP
jgi:hypothetical protein